MPTSISSVITVTASALTAFLSASSVTANAPVDVTVRAFDANGALATNYTAPVNIVLVSGPAGGEITGTVAGTITNGSTVLSGVRFTKQGNYIFNVVSNGLSFTLSITVTGRLT